MKYIILIKHQIAPMSLRSVEANDLVAACRRVRLMVQEYPTAVGWSICEHLDYGTEVTYGRQLASWTVVQGELVALNSETRLLESKA